MSDYDEERVSMDQPGLASINMPKLKKWGISSFYDYVNKIVDYESLESLNTNIKAARMALFQTTDAINKYERLETESKTQYNREWRRAYIQSAERTDTAKKTRADLVCETYEDDVIVNGQVKSELLRVSAALRIELNTLEALGNNLRQQLKME